MKKKSEGISHEVTAERAQKSHFLDAIQVERLARYHWSSITHTGGWIDICVSGLLVLFRVDGTFERCGALFRHGQFAGGLLNHGHRAGDGAQHIADAEQQLCDVASRRVDWHEQDARYLNWTSVFCAVQMTMEPHFLTCSNLIDRPVHRNAFESREREVEPPSFEKRFQWPNKWKKQERTFRAKSRTS